MKIPYTSINATPEGYKETIETLVKRANEMGGYLAIPLADLIEQLDPTNESLMYLSSLLILLEISTYKHHGHVLIDKERLNTVLDIEQSNIYDVLYKVLDRDSKISICTDEHELCIYKEDDKYKCAIDRPFGDCVVTASLSGDSLEELLKWVSATFLE